MVFNFLNLNENYFIFVFVAVDINKHMPITPPAVKSPNNYSISTLHYMERYHLIGSEQNFTSGTSIYIIK